MTLTLSGAPIVLGAFADLTTWTHSWDARESVLYTPGATEQTDYGVDTSLRVASIPDRGTGNLPMLRDQGVYGSTYLLPSPVPGPLWIPDNPGLYRSRPAVQFDIMPNYSTSPKHYAAMSPIIDPFDSDTWFDPPTGLSTPYWLAIFGDRQDATLGEEGTGPTIFEGGLFGGTDWSVAAVDFDEGITFIRTGYDINPDESVMLLYYNSGNGGLVLDSFLEVNHRGANGALIPTRKYGGQDNYPFKEMFYGWVADHGYWTACGIKTGTPTEAELAKVRQWAAMSLPITGSRA